MTCKTTDIVAALSEMNGLKIKQMIARLGELFPDASVEQIDRAFEIAAEEAREEARQADAELEWIEKIMPIFDGLPKGIALEDAAKIKAKQGDLLAKRVLAQLNEPARRLEGALWEAACEADKRWRKTGDGSYFWTGEGKMPDYNQMIEQFQINHPTEARRIEAAIEEA